MSASLQIWRQRFWITADVRLDCRTELEGKLKSAGQRIRRAAPDSELVLGAYAVWGEACVQELRGDFAFAIWDASKRTLFCARDHFGIKPFYYADLGNLLLFSNTLSCLQRHPAVSDRLNDLAIADFLLFDINQDAATTSFADIRRLPAAHSLRCERGDVSIHRYWTLSVTEPVRFRRESEYVEQFHALLGQAVSDRLRTNSAGILMSGGLDSTTVAATARQILAANADGDGLFAATTVVDGLVPDNERHYAALVSECSENPHSISEGRSLSAFRGRRQPGVPSAIPRTFSLARPNTPSAARNRSEKSNCAHWRAAAIPVSQVASRSTSGNSCEKGGSLVQRVTRRAT